MSDFNFSEESLSQIRSLMNNPVFDELRRRQAASQLRNDVTASWIDHFMNRMNPSSTNATINQKTGQPHTVESMVEELRERVKLDSITKQASIDFPLVINATVKKKLTPEEKEKFIEKVRTFIENMFSSHRGYVDDPAVIYECRSQFGDEDTIEFASEIIEEVKKARESLGAKENDSSLPSPYLGQPQRADPTADMFFPLFEHVKNL